MAQRLSKSAVLVTMGATFVLHAALQWLSWASSDTKAHGHSLPFKLLSFPVLWMVPAQTVNDSLELCLVLNSVVWAGVVGLLSIWAQGRRRIN
jgi:hypothetical protein